LKKGFKVVAVEANPILAAQAERRFKAALRDGRLTILNIGIGEERGQGEFHVNLELSEWSSFKPATASRGKPTAPVMVEMCTIGDVVAAYGTPYYLKIDIEGLDGAAVKGLRACAVKPQFVSFENGDLHLFDALIGFGYKRFKFINQADVPSFACPSPAREGATIDYAFPYGASGPFGDDTPGNWLDADAVRPILQQHAGDRASGTYDAVKSGWFDLHAKLN
jgi:FkbM family methyltransferase